jgi:DUF4097 and DUF4098 domain-containing protein YvlB
MAEHSHDEGRGGQGGLGSFLRSLLSGIPWSERAENEETVTIPRPETGAIKIDNANGRTRVVGEERDDIEVHLFKVARAESEEQARALLEGIGLLTREEGDHHLIDFDVPRSWNRRGRVDVELRVPRDLKVSVVAANGRICLSGLRAAVRARSSNGAVRVENVTGDIDIATSNAKVSSVCTCGRLVARSSNGKIELEDHRGSVDAHTSNGAIHCGLAELGKAGIVLATSNGRIVLELPEAVDGDVDIRVDNGVIRSAREFAGSQRSGRLKGTLGRGGAPIKLRASNGTISLR